LNKKQSVRTTNNNAPAYLSSAEETRAVDAAFRKNDARAELVTSLVWMSVIILTYAIFLTGYRNTVEPSLVRNISLLVAIMLPAFGLLVGLIKLGYYSPTMKYINIFLQVTLVSGAIFFDFLSQGANYALSSMPPMAYALVPTVTAFRMQPSLGLFAGAIAALQFLLLYFLIIQPDASLIAEVPSLSVEVSMMKVVILFSLGVASAFAARTLRVYFIDFGKAQEIRTRLERNFGRFVSPEIVEQINENPDGMIPSGYQDAAIIFGDIRGFTSYAAEHDSAEVTHLLNEYFEIVCDIIEQEGGMLNKFLGDGYLALFGVYTNDENPCQSAARAVLRIVSETQALLEPLGLSSGNAGNYGKVITGEVGSSGRCEFTAIGEPVNLAARLEGLNSELGTRFLASASFIEQLPAEDFHITEKGSYKIKGLTREVEVYVVESVEDSPQLLDTSA